MIYTLGNYNHYGSFPICSLYPTIVSGPLGQKPSAARTALSTDAFQRDLRRVPPSRCAPAAGRLGPRATLGRPCRTSDDCSAALKRVEAARSPSGVRDIGSAPERPPPPLASLCQNAVAQEISDDNVFEMLMFADDRQLADLRTECLEHVQRRWNSNLCHWWHKSGGAILPGAGAALQAPSLRSDVERALRGI